MLNYLVLYHTYRYISYAAERLIGKYNTSGNVLELFSSGQTTCEDRCRGDPSCSGFTAYGGLCNLISQDPKTDGINFACEFPCEVSHDSQGGRLSSGG